VTSERDWQCFCQICSGSGDPAEATSEFDAKVFSDVAAYGWHVLKVASLLTPDWAFSIGLWHTYGAPELAVLGLPMDAMLGIINLIGDRVKEGLRLSPDDRVPGILTSGLDVAIRPVDEGWYRHLFGTAIWFAQAPPLPFLQVVWPDRAGLFPWESGFDSSYAEEQPPLWRPPTELPMSRWSAVLAPSPWPFAEPEDSRVFTTKQIVAGESAILHAFHDSDGGWSFTDGGPLTRDDIELVHFAHLVGADPSLADLADMPRGWQASRVGPTAQWQRQTS
jgi:Domain of unknown function (DUF4262)